MRADQIRRYARHVLLPDVGGIGQRRLLAARVVLDDAAGPGAVAICYLAAAGVGTLVVRDAAPVVPADVGFLYERDDVGTPRRQAARARVAALNPDVAVVAEGDGRRLVLPAAADPASDLIAGAAAARALLLEVVAA